jgi:diguanylate cyclase (GGDEF)-like protein/PAS domain S-box-containing protein
MNKKPLNILIVDDDRFSRRAIAEILSKNEENFVFYEAPDESSMVKHLQEKNFDCIIMDYILEKTTGLELVEVIKNRNITTPIIMLTGIGDELLAVKALKTGIYDYMPKKILTDIESRDVLKLSIFKAVEHHKISENKKRSEIALRKSEERYRALVENSPILILRFFPDDHSISFVNDGYCQFFNIKRFEALGEYFFNIIPEDRKEFITSIIASLNSENKSQSFELTFIRNNTARYVYWTIQALYDENGKILEYQCMGDDVTTLKSAENELRIQKHYLQSILDSQDNMLLVEFNEDIVHCNNSFLNFFGLSNIDELKMKLKSITEIAVDYEGFINKSLGKNWVQEIINKPQIERLIAFRDRQDEIKFFSLNINKMSGEDKGYIIEFTDITDHEIRKKSFETKASTDTLTGIFNRRMFDEKLPKEIYNSRKNLSELSLIYFDIDHFKKVNDTFGHNSGDYVLTTLCGIVKKSIRDRDVFARWGGEEFVILLPETDTRAAKKIAEKIRNIIKEYTFETVNKITCSFGVTSYHPDDNQATFINRADKALYYSKENGRDRVTAMQKNSKCQTMTSQAEDSFLRD